jgi:hypothetical protein
MKWFVPKQSAAGRVRRRIGHLLCPGLAAALVVAITCRPASAGPSGFTVAPPYSSHYTAANLGPAPGVPAVSLALTFKADDPNTLLISGFADDFLGTGSIYSIGVTRDSHQHITGFSGTASFFASAPGIDAGLVNGPGGVLFYTDFNNNRIGEIKPGSVAPDKFINIADLGLPNGGVGGLGFVPAGLPGAGGLKLSMGNDSGFYSATVTPDGSGTYDISGLKFESTPGSGSPVVPPPATSAILYAPPGAPGFSQPTMLLDMNDYNGQVQAFAVDSNGNPIVSSLQSFLDGPTGLFGGTVDPVTGDFLFTGFQQPLVSPIVIVKSVAVPEPGALTLAVVSLAGAGAWRRLRAKGRAGN